MASEGPRLRPTIMGTSGFHSSSSALLCSAFKNVRRFARRRHKAIRAASASLIALSCEYFMRQAPPPQQRPRWYIFLLLEQAPSSVLKFAHGDDHFDPTNTCASDSETTATRISTSSRTHPPRTPYTLSDALSQSRALSSSLDHQNKVYCELQSHRKRRSA